MIQYIITHYFMFINVGTFAIVALPFRSTCCCEWFSGFLRDGGFGGVVRFSIVTIVAYMVLWKPLLFLNGNFSALGGAGE
jgi:hypothetical protein